MRLGRPIVALALAVVALTLASCTDQQSGTNTPATVAHQPAAVEVTKTCVDNIFYNGLLPQAAAEAECVQCVTTALGQLGFKQPSGEGADAMIASVRLTAKQSSELNFACDETDASD